MTLRHQAVAIALGAALVASGCGTKCPTESPAKVADLGSCIAHPGDTVSVPVQLCPTCNQTGATCAVDTSAATSSGIIQLDPTVEACENVTSCANTAPACEQNPLTCTFTAPAEGQYRLLVVDGTGAQLERRLLVDPGLTPSCAFSPALTSGG